MLSDRFINDGVPHYELNSVQQNALFHFLLDENNRLIRYETYDCECGCKYRNLIPLAEKDRYGIEVNTKICPECGLVMTNPRMTQDSYNRFYDSWYRPLYGGTYKPGVYHYNIELGKGKAIWDYVTGIIDKESFDKVLEIGCCSGGILKAFQDHGKIVKGIDLGGEYIQFGREKGVDLEQCSSFDLAKSSVKFDLIILNHVFEHFVDIQLELSAIKELLSERGMVYISVPGIMNLRVYRDDFLNYLQNAHVRHFCNGTLRQIMAKYGFQQIAGDETVRGIYKLSNAIDRFDNYYSVEMNYLTELEKRITVKESLDTRNKRNIEVLNTWLRHAISGKRLRDVLKKRNIKEFVMFGAGLLGQRVYDEICDTDIKIHCIYDKNPQRSIGEIRLLNSKEYISDEYPVLIAIASGYQEILSIVGTQNDIFTIQDLLNDMADL